MMPEPGRQAAHVLLDTVSDFDESIAEDPANASALDNVLEKLNDVAAVSASINDDEEVVLDASQLLGGTVVVMNFLVEMAAKAAKIDKEAVIVEARQFIDQDGGAAPEEAGEDD